MFQNASQLSSELLNRLKTNNNTVSVSRRLDWLNQAQDDISMAMDPDNLIVTETISTVSAQRKYYTKSDFNKIYSIIDQTGNVVLVYRNENIIEDVDPDRSDTGAPLFFNYFGFDYVQGQPITASTVDIVSSSASDTSQKVRINGTVDSVDDTELLTLNGTSVVTGTKQFTSIFSVTKNSTTTGKVTANVNDASDTVIAEISADCLGLQKQPVYLWPTPSDVRTLRLRYQRQPRRMVNDEDAPDLPHVFHELILLGALVRGNYDLIRPSLAEEIQKNEYLPRLQALSQQFGNKRAKRSPVMREISFQNNYPLWRAPDVIG